MSIVSVYCKKGGVGKTSFLGYLAHYHVAQGKTVLIISADDQNSVFTIFGCQKMVTEHDDDFIENLLVGEKSREEVVFEARPGMYLMKTLNTDSLSINLTMRRSDEKKLQSMVEDFRNYFDYIFIDYPPSSSRLTELLLEISDQIILVIGLNALGIDGYRNTIQYFVDTDIDINKISYVVPMGYNPVKISPNEALKELKELVPNSSPKAIITQPINDKAEVPNLQREGVSVFDEHQMKDKFHEKNRNEVRKELTALYDFIKLQ